MPPTDETQPAADAFRPTERFAQELTASQPALYAYILSLVGDGDAADDLLQQANLVLWRKSGEYEEGTRFIAWACRVAYNEVRTARKRFARSRLLFDDRMLGELATDAAARADESEPRRRALRRCLNTLSPQQQQLLKRRYTDDEPVQAIAEDLGRPLQSLYQTLYRVRLALLECIRRRTDAVRGGGDA